MIKTEAQPCFMTRTLSDWLVVGPIENQGDHASAWGEASYLITLGVLGWLLQSVVVGRVGSGVQVARSHFCQMLYVLSSES